MRRGTPKGASSRPNDEVVLLAVRSLTETALSIGWGGLPQSSGHTGIGHPRTLKHTREDLQNAVATQGLQETLSAHGLSQTLQSLPVPKGLQRSREVPTRRTSRGSSKARRSSN